MLNRRELVTAGAATLALVAACKKSSEADDEGDISPNEDLMREHGILARVLDIYEGAAPRIASGERALIEPVGAAARIARDFVEAYHERMEEQYVFPRLENARKLADLVAVLRRQHDAGRALTQRILALTAAPAGASDRELLAAALRGYASMFRPHVAREDTVLFPAFKQVAGKAYGDIGEQLEAEETLHFGKGGFEHYVEMLPAIETAAGVGELARFTIDARDLGAAHS